jgi:hypothetical protein
MKKLALTLSLFLVSGIAFADTPKDADAQPAKAQPAKPKAAKKAESSNAAIAAQLEELRQTLQSQQEQLQLLKEELAKRDRQIDEAREAAATANARAAEASTKAIEAVNTTAEVKSSAVALNSTVSALKASNEALKTTVAKEQAEEKKAEETGPSTIKYKGINITPGGFLAAETVYRQRATSADIPTPMSAIPYPGNALAKDNESNFSGRQSRISVLLETKVADAKVSGYYEADFFAAGTTSNNRQTNSYVLRQRQAWLRAAFDSGLSFTGGQMWTLATENKKGIENRGEAIPLTVDVNYTVGFTYARGYGFRVVKDFGGKFALGISIEGPQATIGGRGFSLLTTNNLTTGAVSTSGNTFINAPGAGGGLYNAFDPTGYTVNKVPDLLVKGAADPGWGHYEFFGLLSAFRNRVYPCGVVGTNTTDTNPGTTTIPCPFDPGNPTPKPSALGAYSDTKIGGGFGVSANIPTFAKKLDFGIKGVAGSGIGRYGAAQIADLTIRPDGTQALIRTAHGLVRFEFHATPKLDIYAYYGSEYAWRAGYRGYNSITIVNTPGIPANGANPAIAPTTTTTFKLNQIGGYGNPLAINSGCSTEGAPANQLTPGTGATNCAGDIRLITEGTLGFWHKIYQGPKGGVRWGLQYSYITKGGWSGAPAPGGTLGLQPKAVDNMVFTSFRYYLP